MRRDTEELFEEIFDEMEELDPENDFTWSGLPDESDESDNGVIDYD